MSFAKVRGFTLIEILIALILVGVMLAIAVPSFQDATQRRQVQGLVDELQSTLTLAKTEAVKRNEQVTVAFTRTSATEWCVGFRNGGAACDCTQTDTTQADYCGLYADDGTLQTTYRLLVVEDDNVELDAAPIFEDDAIYAIDPSVGVLAEPGGGIDYAEGGDCNPFPEADNENGVISLTSSDGDYAVRLCVFPTGSVNVCRKPGTKGLGGIEACT